jgi:hypothetical protein
LSGKGFGRYAANAAVALRALQSGMMTVEQVGTAGGTYEGEWVDGEWHGYGSFPGTIIHALEHHVEGLSYRLWNTM